jgi:hypothetical protein
MSKTFFTDEIINSYVNYNLNGEYPIQKSLGGYELLNYSLFMNWWNDYLRYPNGLNESIKASINGYFKEIFTSKCEDLNPGYIHRAIDSLGNNPNFDVLFAVYNKSNVILLNENPSENEIKKYQSLKSDSVGGFIIVQKGECKNLPQTQTSVANDDFKNVYSVFLICTSSNSSNDSLDKLFGKIISKKSPPPIKGQLLMGAYLFTIKSNESLLPQIAVLELLSGYTNIPGFISYSKLGFEKDLNLYGNGCFTSLTTLPMSNYWITKEPHEIIQALAEDVELVIDKEARTIINFYKSNKDVKKKERLGVFCNILYRIELRDDKILEDLIHVYDDGDDDGDDDESNYEKMQNFFGYEETDDLTSVFYDKKKAFVDDDDYDQDRNIQKSNYPKIIAKIKQYYKNEINNMMLLSKTNNYNHKLHYIDCDDHDDDVSQPKKRCKTRLGGKKQKTNKKHIQHKKKTKARTKQNNKKTSKKPRKTRR